MFESLVFIAVGLVGALSAVTGTLPCLLVAMFGDTNKLLVSGLGGGGVLGSDAKVSNLKDTFTQDGIVYKPVVDPHSSTGYVWAFDYIITQEPQSATAAEHTQSTGANVNYLGLSSPSPGITQPTQTASTGSTTPTPKVFGVGVNPAVAGLAPPTTPTETTPGG
jgi:hypothetical protein